MAENNKKIEEAQKKLVSDSEYYTMLGKTAILVAFRLKLIQHLMSPAHVGLREIVY